ncbi:glycosyltransferase 87 family protein [Actinoplanes sp. TRM 88003]|uniref:Glycosyltransferase 87 family protein n=1 Tax=Paractinoplanes aksuensis TaxID=2939490 RepID=A0ABT1E3J4_9ACTN|nr:mannosyltransferase family protein [Actinoplanes aksuensis]MCO8277700.1 glycosyltransferase 87 family protein [Actinoplanes aksuensis]
MTATAVRPQVDLKIPVPTSKWRPAWLAASAVWSASIVVHVLVSALAWLTHEGNGPAPDFWSAFLGWNNWDAQHYVRIAESGYVGLSAGYPAFFPLYPLLIHVFDPLLPGDGMVSALVVANAAAFGALAVLYRLADHEFGPRVAQRAAWYLAVFPMGFFLFIGYNESLFLLLVVGALYAARRGHWWLAGSLGALSSATRLFGLLLILPLAVEYVRQVGRRPRRDVLALALVPLGVVAYSVYCLIELGSPVQFSIAQDQWGRRYTVPGEAWLISIRQMTEHGLLHKNTLGAIVDAGTILIAVVLLVLCVKGPFRFRRDQMYLVVQGAITLVMLMSTEVGGRSMQSSARYAMEAVAIFLLLARMGANRTADRAILVVGASLQAVFLVVFMAGTFLVA